MFSIKVDSNNSDDSQTELLELRNQVDQIDEDILLLISKRFSVTEEIGAFKAKHHLDPQDNAREAKQFKTLKRLAKELGLPDKLEKVIFSEIMDATKKRHIEIASE